MKRLKKLIFICFVVFSGFVCAEGIQEGKYVFYSPAMFGIAAGEPRGELCEIERCEDQYRIYFLDAFRQGSFIKFSVKDDKIIFDKTQWAYTEF